MPGPDESPATPEQAKRAREQAEAEAAVAAVMQGVAVKAAAMEAKEQANAKKPAPLKLYLLLALVAFNLYAWIGNPEWLRFREPELPAPSYYANSYKVAVFLQRQRIEEYRRAKGRLPNSASQAGPPVKGVVYEPLHDLTYVLLAGEGERKYVYRSADSLAALVGRAFVDMSMLTVGAR